MYGDTSLSDVEGQILSMSILTIRSLGFLTQNKRKVRELGVGVKWEKTYNIIHDSVSSVSYPFLIPTFLRQLLRKKVCLL